MNIRISGAVPDVFLLQVPGGGGGGGGGGRMNAVLEHSRSVLVFEQPRLHNNFISRIVYTDLSYFYFLISCQLFRQFSSNKD